MTEERSRRRASISSRPGSRFGTLQRADATRACQTPFPSTYQRRIRTGLSEIINTRRRSRTGDLTNITNLIKKTWITYSCSPLHRFACDILSLKRYSRLLSAVLTANARKRVAVGTDETEIGAKATFSIAKGVAVLQEEPEAIQLCIFTKEGKMIAEFCFCSVEADSLLSDVGEIPVSSSRHTEETISDCFTVLPLLLCKGNLTPRKIIFDWLKTEFDCNIRKLEFSTLSLAWTLGMWAAICPNEEKPKSTRLIWKIPVPGIGLDHIETDFDHDSIAVLWKGAHQGTSDIVELSEIENFLGGIQEHLTQHFRIKFQALPLHQINMEIVHLHTEGKIKMLSVGHIHTCLAHLTCLAIEQLSWVVPFMEE